MRPTPRRDERPARLRRTSKLLLFDTFLLMAVCLLEAVSLTGLTLHEWLALGFAGALMIHLLLQWPWIAGRTRRLLSAQTRRTGINYFINLGLFTAMVATILSGTMISEVVLPAIGRA